jgi:predicted dehydrogenase
MADGTPIEVKTPDFVVAALELSAGTVIRLTTNFYVGWHGKQKGIEFHGDSGSLYLSSWESFNAKVEYAEFEKSYGPLPYVKEPYSGIAGGLPIDWGRALAELADAIADGRPHRASAEQAAHIVEILNAVTESYKQGCSIPISSNFIPPKPMEWAL